MNQWQKIIDKFFCEKELVGLKIIAHHKRFIITWNIGTNSRPAKRSVEIIIDIEDEINYDLDQKSTEKVIRYLDKKYNEFEPQHNTPDGHQQPQVKWTLSFDLLD